MAILTLLLAVIGAIAFTVAGLTLVRRFVQREVGRGHNEMSGAIFAVGGTIYAVFLAFVVIAAWEANDAARADVGEEASLLTTLYRASTAMDQQSGDRLRGLIREYTEDVINEEWAAQEHGGTSQKARRAGLEMYRLFGAQSPELRQVEEVIDQQQLQTLAQIQADRNKRTLLSQERLSPLIWWTAIVNGVLVVVMSFFLYPDSNRSHVIMSAALAVMIVVLLHVISLFAKPFGGLMPLKPDAFAHSLEVYDSVDRTL
jgi:hypothetical protein